MVSKYREIIFAVTITLGDKEVNEINEIVVSMVTVTDKEPQVSMVTVN